MGSARCLGVDGAMGDGGGRMDRKMAKVIVNGATVDVSSLSDTQISMAVEIAIEDDNHAAQNAEGATARDWFTRYCDLCVVLHGQFVTI